MKLMMIVTNYRTIIRWRWILLTCQQVSIPKKLQMCQFLLKTLELIAQMRKKKLKKW
uniref:Uncharacterized protein n=1 Tax=Arundo donax TaxID=35708 RepID=A0A0A9HI47_ARUDO